MLSYVMKEDCGMPFDQKRYVNSYNKEKYKSFLLRVRKDNKAIMEKLESERNVNNYILRLIDNDVNPGVLTIKQIKELTLPVFRKHNIKEVYLFGSYSRGEARKESDVDLFCEGGDIESLLDHVRVQRELKEALGKDVDLITFGSSMNTTFKNELDKDKIKLW